MKAKNGPRVSLQLSYRGGYVALQMNAEEAIHRTRAVIRRQHKALATETSYVSWLRRYMIAVQQYPPSFTSEQKLERFLSDLARERDISASSQNQAFNAVLFFYRDVLGRPLKGVDALRASKPARMRSAPSMDDTRALLKTIRNIGGYPTSLIARLLYGCGLRVSEPLNLRIKDVDLQRRRLCIRGAKGGKDRMVVMPEGLVPEINQQIRVAYATWVQDGRNGVPVMLPEGLARKYPDFQFTWKWAWLFPARSPLHPRTRTLVRYRLHEVNVQRAVKIARRQLGICVLPHELRHGYATHCLERGANPRAIQAAMGHQSLETTMGYLHAESLSVPSPLEILDPDRTAMGPLDPRFPIGEAPHARLAPV
ncbi:MAG: integron integrase [Opitutaceae bacterium]